MTTRPRANCPARAVSGSTSIRIRWTPPPCSRAIHANRCRMCGQVPRVWATTPRPRSTARPIRHTCVAWISGVRSTPGSGRSRRAHQLRACPESITRTSPAGTGAISSPRRP
ncbi:hypothetical protein BJF79_30135 [Actinomadura sp. CNU-125]|nr:hypothetical protein BJF79_30135 [Actinomadura sp. CNU-125]